MSTPSQFHRCWPDLPSWQLRCAPHSQLHSFTGAGPFEFAQGRLGIRASRRDSVTVSQVHSFTARKAELAENEGKGVKCKDSCSSQLHPEYKLSGRVALIVSNFQGPKLRFGQSVYPRGVGG